MGFKNVFFVICICMYNKFLYYVNLFLVNVVIFRDVNGCCVGYFWNVFVDKCEGRLLKI